MPLKVEAGWVRRRMDEGEALVVDVDPPGPFQEGHLPGAKNIPFDDGFGAAVQEAAPGFGTPVIVYAHPGSKASEEAARRLESMGYQHVYEFRRGLEGWLKAGYELERGEPVTTWAGRGTEFARVHDEGTQDEAAGTAAAT